MSMELGSRREAAFSFWYANGMTANRIAGVSPPRRFGALPRIMAALAVLILLRTFVVSGLLLPHHVAGPSMAPTLLGAHYFVACPSCSFQFPVDGDSPPVWELAKCPRCGAAGLQPTNSAPRAGDRVLIDRASPLLFGYRRWDVVAAPDPEQPRRNAVKRIVGLPGETIEFRAGKVWIDGARPRRTAGEIQRTSVAVDAELTPSPAGDAAGEWFFVTPRSARSGGRITDELSYNAAATHVVSPASDVFLRVRLRCGAQDRCVALAGGDPRFGSATFDGPAQTVEVQRGESRSIARWPGETHADPIVLEVEVAWFDDGLTAQFRAPAADPVRLELPPPLESQDAVAPSAGVSLGLFGPTIEIIDWELRRGLVYAAERGKIRLGPDEYLLLGDNAAVSIDARSWAKPAIDRNQLLGKVIRLGAPSQAFMAPGGD